MECPRGSATTSQQHVVKTKNKAEEWARKSIEERQLPVTIYQDKASNGRLLVRVVDSLGKTIELR